jgi:hypothetical protein
VPVLYASPNPTLSTKIATDSNGREASRLSTKTQYPWHHSVDKKPYFLYEKFDVSLIFLSGEKPYPTKSGTFHGDGPPLFESGV